MFYGEVGLLCSRSRSQQNFVWWCIIIGQIVFQKDLFTIFKVKVTVKDNVIKIWLFTISSELLILLQLNLVWWYIIISQSVLWKNWITAFRVKVTAKGQDVNVCPDDIFEITKHFVFKLGIVMHHCESECHAKRSDLLFSRSRSL